MKIISGSVCAIYLNKILDKVLYWSIKFNDDVRQGIQQTKVMQWIGHTILDKIIKTKHNLRFKEHKLVYVWVFTEQYWLYVTLISSDKLNDES